MREKDGGGLIFRKYDNKNKVAYLKNGVYSKENCSGSVGLRIY